jgi:hypothetical protein
LNTIFESLQILIAEVYSNYVLCVRWLQVVEMMYSNQGLADKHFMYRLVDGRALATAWPPRSPDLNPLDFYLWDPLKSLVSNSPKSNCGSFSDHMQHARALRLSSGGNETLS